MAIIEVTIRSTGSASAQTPQRRGRSAIEIGPRYCHRIPIPASFDANWGAEVKASDFTTAENALRRCRDSYEALRTCNTAQRFSDSWSDFLIAQQRVFTKLAAGATGGKSAPWFGAIKALRNSDELLRYIHQARHTDEHGLAQIADARNPTILISPRSPDEPLHIENLQIRNGRIEHFAGRNAAVEFTPADATLLPVTNRGITYNLPTTHLGAPWTSSSALDMAASVLKYLEGIVAEGRAFISP